MPLTDRQRQKLQNNVRTPEVVNELWKWVHKSAVARISLRHHYMNTASLELDRELKYNPKVSHGSRKH